MVRCYCTQVSQHSAVNYAGIVQENTYNFSNKYLSFFGGKLQHVCCRCILYLCAVVMFDMRVELILAFCGPDMLDTSYGLLCVGRNGQFDFFLVLVPTNKYCHLLRARPIFVEMIIFGEDLNRNRASGLYIRHLFLPPISCVKPPKGPVRS